jgi:hypothetical protein
MTSGGLTKAQAMKLQRFTGRLRCELSDDYDGRREPPTCYPPCEACLLKWLNRKGTKSGTR